MRLGDLDALKAEVALMFGDKTHVTESVCELIDNAPTVEPERSQGECKTCRHRDPEDKKCDCGGQERQGCLWPVSDDYYCKYYEKDNQSEQVGKTNFDEKFADLIVFNNQPQCQLNSLDVHEDV